MLVIDTREAKLIDAIKFHYTQNKIAIPIAIEPLAIGDIIITYESRDGIKYTVIIERKCIPDMIASIKDGRYKEQKIRLKAEMANTSSSVNYIKIVYLIEGSQSELRLPQDKTMLNGAIISSQFRDNIPIIRTFTILETIEILTRFHDRLNKDPLDIFPTRNITPNTPITPEIPNPPLASDSVSDTVADGAVGAVGGGITAGIAGGSADGNEYGNEYINSLQNIKKCKKDNITPQNWNIMCYMNIPGISNNIAIKIAEKYSSINVLITAYNGCSNDTEREKLLADIILTDNGKTKRRIGDVISKRVFDYIIQK